MATLFPGYAPEILTVSASPTPTSTVFTVSSATNLIQGQWINVQVSSAFQRAKITDITGNQLTVTGLSGAPDAPGEVRNSRSLIAISHIQAAGVFEADDIADLKTVPTTYAPNGLKYLVPEFGTYRLDITSSLTADDYNVVAPTTGPGRWIMIAGAGTARAIASITALKAIVTTGVTYAMKAEIPEYGVYTFDPTSTLSPDDITVIKPTTGTGRWLLTYACPDIIIGMIDEELESINEIADRIADTYLGSIFTIASIGWTSIATISLQTQTVVCIGARVGDIVAVGMPDLDTSNRFSLQYVGVKTDDVITITVRNNHTASLTPNTGTWKFEVRRTSL